MQQKQTDDGCSTVNLNESNLLQHSLDPDSKITLGHLSPERLSPNIFLSMNLDNVDERHNINVEWSNYNEVMPSSSSLHQQQQQHDAMSSQLISHQNQYIRTNLLNSSNIIDMNNCLNLDHTGSPYDDIKFLGVDHFHNMDSFKSDCILNMDHSIILDENLGKAMGVSSVLLDEHTDELDMRDTFGMHDSMEKSMPLLDLEKPVININVDSLALNDSQINQLQQQ